MLTAITCSFAAGILVLSVLMSLPAIAYSVIVRGHGFESNIEIALLATNYALGFVTFTTALE